MEKLSVQQMAEIGGLPVDYLKACLQANQIPEYAYTEGKDQLEDLDRALARAKSPNPDPIFAARWKRVPAAEMWQRWCLKPQGRERLTRPDFALAVAKKTGLSENAEKRASDWLAAVEPMPMPEPVAAL